MLIFESEENRTQVTDAQLPDPPLREALVTKEPLPCCTVLQATENKSPSAVMTDRQSRQACLSYVPSLRILYSREARLRRRVGMVEGRGRTKEVGQ